MVLRECPRCLGTGRILLEKSAIGILFDVITGEDDYTCPLCHGRGYISDDMIEVHGRHEVHVSGINESLRGVSDVQKRADYAPERCARCGGTGNVGTLGYSKCPSCGGQGSVMVAQPARRCARCGGTGNVGTLGYSECPSCGGTGWAHALRG